VTILAGLRGPTRDIATDYAHLDGQVDGLMREVVHGAARHDAPTEVLVGNAGIRRFAETSHDTHAKRIAIPIARYDAQRTDAAIDVRAVAGRRVRQLGLEIG
jgi:hypothetical protein